MAGRRPSHKIHCEPSLLPNLDEEVIRVPISKCRRRFGDGNGTGDEFWVFAKQPRGTALARTLLVRGDRKDEISLESQADASGANDSGQHRCHDVLHVDCTSPPDKPVCHSSREWLVCPARTTGWHNVYMAEEEKWLFCATSLDSGNEVGPAIGHFKNPRIDTRLRKDVSDVLQSRSLVAWRI